MARPTVRIPLWAGGGTKTDPGGSKEDSGWLVSERPPANWINWIYNAFGQWLGYFDAMSPRVLATVSVVSSSTGSVSSNSFGVSSVTADTTDVNVHLSDTMADTDYFIFAQTAVSSDGQYDRFVAVSQAATNNIKFRFYDQSTGTLVSPTSAAVKFYLQVIGDIA